MFKSAPYRLCFLLLALLSHSSQVAAADIIVASAANFRPVLKQLKTEFEQQQPHKLKLVFASSGKLYAQIRHGAPFQVFLSADQKKPQALIAKGLAEQRFTYAIGRLVLYSSNPHLIDAKRLDTKPSSLLQLPFQHLALANPKLAPYGRASIEVLEQIDPGLTSRKRWVKAENINQSYQFIASGNAELGFIGLAQLKALAQSKGSQLYGSFWLPPETLYRPIKQDAVLLSRNNTNAAQLKASQSFINFLQSDKSQALIKSYGYDSASSKIKEPN